MQARPERLGQHPGIVQRVVRTLLYDSEVRGQRLQLVVGQRQPQLLGERDGAEPVLDRGDDRGARVLPGQHRPVEGGVVRDEHAAREPLGQLGGDFREEWGTLQDIAGQAVDPDGAGVPLRVDEGVPVVLDVALRVQPVDGSGHYPVVPGESRGLHVDDRVPLWVGGRPRCCGLAVVEHGHREYGPGLTAPIRERSVRAARRGAAGFRRWRAVRSPAPASTP